MSDTPHTGDHPDHSNPAEWPHRSQSTVEGPFLAGPRSRLSELLRVMRISGEFIRGFRKLHFVGPCVTVFGSARFPEDHPHYALAREMGARIARAGLTVLTGGGPGIMEAANRGARDANGRSIGCNIRLPAEQQPNPYLDRFVEFKYFFVRKVMLVKYSVAFIVMPGGFGTLDEVFETATLIQTRKINSFPIIVMGTDYWRPLIDFIRGPMVQAGTISPEDAQFVTFTDSADEAMDAIERARPRKREGPRPSALLAERRHRPDAPPESAPT